MFKSLYRLFLTLYFLWKFRRTIWALLCDLDDLCSLSNNVLKARDEGMSGLEKAQQSMKDLLNLKSFGVFVESTEAKSDNEMLAQLKKFVSDNLVFKVAWKLINGDWDINIEQSRWGSFVSRVKEMLPFVNKTKAVKALASHTANDEPLTEELEAGVIDVIMVVSLVLYVLPRVLSILKSEKGE